MSDPKSGAPRALNCPNCGAPIVVRAAGLTVSVICENCGSTLDATDPALRLIHQSNAALARPQIPLGSRGVLTGTEWEVVGYLERSGDGGQWQEYLLFNPWTGYRFLVHGDGWRLGQALDALPTEIGERAALDGRTYDFQARYPAQVDFVVGEFYWRVAVGETVDASDYGEPWQGTTLSREANAREIGWTRLDSVPAATVAGAFGVDIPPDDDEEDDPVDRRADLRGFLVSLAIAAIAFVALLVILIAAPDSKQVAEATFLAEPDGPVVTRILGPIDLSRRASAVQVRATTEVQNAWVELDYALVERRTQQRFEASTTAEYYTGSDSDGSWSEGDPRPAALFASIPQGRYDLVVEAQAKQWQQSGSSQGSYDFSGVQATPETPRYPPVAVTVAVIRDTGFGSLFVLALLGIAIVPAWLLWRLLSGRRSD